MELFNELRGHRRQDVEDFLTFIPIYESKRRTAALAALLKRHRRQIKGRVTMEAGAGRGIFSRLMADLGARKVFAVERAEVMYDLLKAAHADRPEIECHCEEITEFVPEEQVDLVFHELYGPLVLDETMLALRELLFKPGMVLPDGGRLWAMPLTHEQMAAADPNFQPEWANVLRGALISDLVSGVRFEPRWEVFRWNVDDARTEFEFELPEACDFLALCGEITHRGKHVLNMWWTHNWPVIYTPVAGKRFRLRFVFKDGFTLVHFDWR